jgi:hypothetical protein
VIRAGLRRLVRIRPIDRPPAPKAAWQSNRRPQAASDEVEMAPKDWALQMAASRDASACNLSHGIRIHAVVRSGRVAPGGFGSLRREQPFQVQEGWKPAMRRMMTEGAGTRCHSEAPCLTDTCRPARARWQLLSVNLFRPADICISRSWITPTCSRQRAQFKVNSESKHHWACLESCASFPQQLTNSSHA